MNRTNLMCTSAILVVAFVISNSVSTSAFAQHSADMTGEIKEKIKSALTGAAKWPSYG